MLVVLACLPFLGLLGLLALRKNGGDNGGPGSPSSPGGIASDTWFYGQSPPVYPSRESCVMIIWSHGSAKLDVANMAGSGSWAVAFEKAAALVANMTLDEKVS